jgi:hypothetical protein
MRAIFLLVVAVVAAAITAMRKMKGRQQVQLLESGGMCIHCRSTNVTRGEKGVVCGACGQTTSWALIKQPPLSAEDIDKMNTPDKRNRF